MADEPRSDDLSMIGYPSKDLVECAIVKVIGDGVTPTPTNVADEIGRRAGLRPGDDVTDPGGFIEAVEDDPPCVVGEHIRFEGPSGPYCGKCKVDLR